MGKFGIGARVRDDDGDCGEIVDKRKGERRVTYDDTDFGSIWRPKDRLSPLSPESDTIPAPASAHPAIFEKEYSVGDRVRLVKDNGEYGSAGDEGVVADTEKTPDGIRIDFKTGVHAGDYWFVPADILERLPVIAHATTWEPKVGDRVRMAKSVDGELSAVPATIHSHRGSDYLPWLIVFDEPVGFGHNGHGVLSENNGWFVGSDDIEPLPVAAEAQPAAPIEPAAELWAPVAGKFGQTRDGRKVGPLRRGSSTDPGHYWVAPETASGFGSAWHQDGAFHHKDSPYWSERSFAFDLVAEWVEPAVATEVAEVAVAEATATPPESKFGFTVGDQIRPKQGKDAAFLNDHYATTFATTYGESDGNYFVRGFTGVEVGISAKNEGDVACYFYPTRFEPAAPPAKFKVGDRVYMKADGARDEAVIATRNSEGVMSLKWPHNDEPGNEWWRDDELVLVSPPPAAPTLPIGSTVTFAATGRLSAINDNGHLQVVFKDLAPAQNSFALPARYVSAA